jgi:hypothetical protein
MCSAQVARSWCPAETRITSRTSQNATRNCSSRKRGGSLQRRNPHQRCFPPWMQSLRLLLSGARTVVVRCNGAQAAVAARRNDARIVLVRHLRPLAFRASGHRPGSVLRLREHDGNFLKPCDELFFSMKLARSFVLPSDRNLYIFIIVHRSSIILRTTPLARDFGIW